MSVGLPPSLDELVFTSHQTVTGSATNSNEYILSDFGSLEGGANKDLNYTELKDCLQSKMDLKDMDISIKKELPDSDCDDSISNGDPATTEPFKTEYIDSKDSIKNIKLEPLDSGLESQEEILPDVAVALVPPTKEEKRIVTVDRVKSNVINKGKSLNEVQSKPLVKTPTKTNITTLRFENVNKELKDINGLGDRDNNKTSGYLFCRNKKGYCKKTRTIGIDDQIKTKVTNNDNIQQVQQNQLQKFC